MITKAIIEEILDNGYHARVRIPIYHKSADSPYGTPRSQLPIASICCEPGSIPSLKVGDIVFVGFEEDITSQPVIIGMLFRTGDASRTNLRVSSLQVDVNTVLSSDLTVGETTSNDLNNLKNTKGNLQSQIDLLEQRLILLEKGGSSITPSSDIESWYINLNQTVTEFIENSDKEDWAKLYYIDIAVTQAKTNMIAKIMVDTEKTSKTEIGYITFTEIINDGSIRVYFSNKPTSYTFLSVQLLTCKEV